MSILYELAHFTRKRQGFITFVWVSVHVLISSGTSLYNKKKNDIKWINAVTFCVTNSTAPVFTISFNHSNLKWLNQAFLGFNANQIATVTNVTHELRIKYHCVDVVESEWLCSSYQQTNLFKFITLEHVNCLCLCLFDLTSQSHDSLKLQHFSWNPVVTVISRIFHHSSRMQRKSWFVR